VTLVSNQNIAKVLYSVIAAQVHDLSERRYEMLAASRDLKVPWVSALLHTANELSSVLRDGERVLPPRDFLPSAPAWVTKRLHTHAHAQAE
jgi:hypothetical protein